MTNRPQKNQEKIPSEVKVLSHLRGTRHFLSEEDWEKMEAE